MITSPVDPVKAAAPTTGLYASAVKPPGGDRWESGMAWRPERCIALQTFGPCTDPDTLPVEPDAGVAYHFPTGYRVRDYCTTIGGELDTSRLQRQADAVLSYALAHELWTGEQSIADPGELPGSVPFVNDHLAAASATTIVGTGTLAEKFGQLEQEAREAALGQQVFLHIPIHLVTPLAEKLRRSGQMLYTALDSVVVADGGYPGTGPAGTGTEWAYATGPVQVRASALEIYDDPTQTVNRQNNRQEIWASRFIAATFDPCLHLAMNLAAA